MAFPPLRPRCFIGALLLVSGPALAGPEPAPARLPVELPLRVFVNRLLEQNKTIRSRGYERDMTATGTERASAAFQPTFNAQATTGELRQQNTAEEDLFRSNLGVYQRRGQDYSAGVSKVFSTGTKLEGKVTLSRFMTNLIAQQRPGQDENYRTFYGVTLMQPLARDAGIVVNTAKVRVAELDTEAADHAVNDTKTRVIAEAVSTYYDLALAERRFESAEAKVSMARRINQLVSQLYREGRLPQSEVWEVESSQSRFESGRSEAQQLAREQLNRLRSLLLAVSDEVPDTLKTRESLPEVIPVAPDFNVSVQTALENRDDFRMRKLMVEREDVQIAYTRNQGWPRVDMVASYGLNGLDLSTGRAFDVDRNKDYATWNVGLQFSMPLFENRQARADTTVANLRKEDALLSLKALEVAIANDIDTSLGMLTSAAERWSMWQEVASREDRQIALERQRFQSGRSDTREMILREERGINAHLAVVEQQVAWLKASTLLQAAQGTLLKQYQ
jgi:outer membrane protein TolC